MRKSYKPRFFLDNCSVKHKGEVVGNIDSNGIITLYLDKHLPDKISYVLDRNELEHAASNLKDRLYVSTEHAIVEAGKEFNLDKRLLQDRYHGMAMLSPVARALYARAEKKIVPEALTQKPKYIMPARGAAGTVTVDQNKNNVIVDEPIKYSFYFLHDSEKDVMRWYEIMNAVTGIERLKFWIIEEEHGKDLEPFAKFITKKGLAGYIK